MENPRSITRLLLVSIMLCWSSTGCNNGDNGPAPQGSCRIQRIASTTKTVGTNGTDETVYSYDAAGNLTMRTETSANTYSAGGSQNITSTDAYAYDADNFLMRSISSTTEKAVSFAGKASDYQLTSTKTYAYANDRLAGYTQRDLVFDSNVTTSPQQRTTVTTSTYEYDASGQLTKQLFSNGGTWTYRNGQAVDHEGSYPLSLQDGLITKATFPGTSSTGNPLTLVQSFQYDAQRHLTKYQEFINDSLTTYYTQEWQTGKIAASAIPALKGHPVVKSPAGEQGVRTKYRAYSVNYQRAVSQYLEKTETSQLNAQGFVTTAKSESISSSSGQKQPDVTTTAYTYTGCN